MMVDSFYLALLQLLEQRQPVHPRHVDVADHHVDVLVGLQRRQRIDAVAGEQEVEGAVLDLAAELLKHQGFQVRFVVDNQN